MIKRIAKISGWILAILIIGHYLGEAWYWLWWNVDRTPTPPFSRYVLPHEKTGYHTIRWEMQNWMTVVTAILIWLIVRKKRIAEPAGGAYVLPAADDPSAHP